MNRMGWIATSVMGPRLISLYENNSRPLNRMTNVRKEGTGSMNGIMELPKQKSIVNTQHFITVG